jgi:hypothetical protein
MAKNLAIVQFEERPYQVYFEDYRIFIQGVEVTQHVMGGVTIQKSNRDGSGTASFTLDNAMDKFVITDQNLAGKWRDTNDKYSEAAKHGIYLYKTGQDDTTINRIQELIDVLMEQELDIQFANSDSVAKSEYVGNRRRAGKSARTRDPDQMRAVNSAKRVLDRMPSASLTSAENREKVRTALADSMTAAGMDPKDAAVEAASLSSARTLDLVNAGGSRPNADGPVAQANPGGGSPERRGTYKSPQSLRNPIDPDTGQPCWSLEERSVIFHKNDPIRIFVHNPLTESDHWIYGFTGYIDKYPLTRNYINGQSSVQIQCYDIRQPMSKMRVSMNQTLPLRRKETLFTDRSSIFADMLNPTKWGHSFANRGFENAMAILITGTTVKREVVHPPSRFGVGDFKVGKVVTYPLGETVEEDPKGNATLLEAWHSLCLNGPGPIADEKTLAFTGALTTKEVEKIGRGTTSDGPFSPTSGYVHFLLPNKGTTAYTLAQEQFGVTDQVDWQSRFQILTDFCALLDYEMTVLPNGDIVFEFPMYDFTPEDFGAYQSVFEADMHLTDGGFEDESNDIVTGIIVTGGTPRPQVEDRFQGATNQGLIPRAAVQSSVLASRVGMTVEQVTFPLVQQNMRILHAHANLELQKRQANANTFDSSIPFRPFMVTNRPFLNKVEQRLGIISSISETIQTFGECTTTPNVRYVRTRRDDGTFRYISTSGESMPISYRKLFPGKRKSFANIEGTGIRGYPSFDGEPSLLEDDKTTSKTAPEAGATNEGHPPSFIGEIRPGTYFALRPEARRVVESLAQEFYEDQERKVLLANAPMANSRSFAFRAREPDGRRIYSDSDRLSLALKAKDLGYTLIDTRIRFVFEPRRAGQPDFIVRPENG